MTERLQVYKCEICGNVVEVLHPGLGKLICCGRPMTYLGEKSKDVGLEKHVPIIEKTEKGVRVKVGSIPHPMEPGHYIEWIELVDEDKVCRRFLRPGEMPEAEFAIEAKELEKMRAREYCNLHGLWSSR